MGKIVDRVQSLVRLATDDGTSDTEARAAAFQACRLISKYSLKLTENAQPPPTQTIRDETVAARAARSYPSPPPWPSGWNDPPPHPSEDSFDDKPETEPKAPWAHNTIPTPAYTRIIICKHSGRCRSCGTRVLAGQSAVWAKDMGITHTGSCAAWWN